MDINKEFFDNFSQLLKPVDDYKGELKTLKELFDDRLEKYSIAQYQAEALMGLQRRTLDGILDKSAIRVDAINLLKLSQFLGLSEDEFMKVYIQEMSPETIAELENTRRYTFILAHFDIKILKKANFLDKIDFEEIENKIKKFFGLKSIYDYSQKGIYIPAFSRTKRSPHTLMREFWVTSAIAQFELLNNPHSYSRDELIDLMPKIRPYTMNVEKGLKTVIQALYHSGVTVIYQPHVPTTQVRGATFVVNGKPCIALTDLNKNYATIWFALLHELHHVLYDYDEIEKQVFHMTGENDLFLLQEDAANEFASEYLFSNERLKYIAPHIDNHFLVSTYAKEAQVHPCIIYSFYQYKLNKETGYSAWGHYKEHFPDINIALKELKEGNPFEYNTIEESVKFLKENIYNI